MGLLVSKWISLLALITILPQTGNASSCQGRGTVVFFGNGMFNSKRDADSSRKALENFLKRAPVFNHEKDLKVDLAYKRNEGVLEQLAVVAIQKGITYFEDYWLWLSSLEEAPDWFKETMKSASIDVLEESAKHFSDLEEHFEGYARYVRNGYNVILVSHSQGNFYANQTMRNLSRYTDASLTGSIEEKKQINPFFPKFFDLFVNIQVATPVSATINDSPWLTFKDDLVMAAVRQSTGALPANLSTSGIGLPPNGDFLGHNFVYAYLRNEESRNKILSNIQNAYSKLHYPIAYFKNAFLITHSHSVDNNADVFFETRDPSWSDYGGGHDEKWPNPNLQVQMDSANCFELKPGDSKIIAETIVPDRKSATFQYRAWPEGGVDLKKEKSIDVSFQASEGVEWWDVGVIHTKAGSGKEPLDVQIEIYPQPRLRR